MNHININAILCKNYDEKSNSIVEVFNTLKMNGNTSFDFNLILFVSVLGQSYYNVRIYIQQILDENNQKVNRHMYIGNYNFPPKDLSSTEISEENHFHASINGTTVQLLIPLEAISFPGKGEYQLKIYVSENEAGKEIEIDYKKEVNESANLISINPFKII